MGSTDDEKTLLSEIQCSFLEQEVNWGPHDFQLRTFFGLKTIDDPLFSEGVPLIFTTRATWRTSFEVYAETKSVEMAMKTIDKRLPICGGCQQNRHEAAQQKVLGVAQESHFRNIALTFTATIP